MLGKKLKQTIVTYSPGQVGLTFIHIDAPNEHFLFSLTQARELSCKLVQACELATPKPTGDSVSVSEHVSMKIG